MSGKTKTVKLLLETNKCNINEKNLTGHTVLILNLKSVCFLRIKLSKKKEEKYFFFSLKENNLIVLGKN